MKFSEKIASYQGSHPFYTFEFFPPRTDEGFENLQSRIARLNDLQPLGISITWGAGGSTKHRSLELAQMSQRSFGIDTLLHLTCTNMEKGAIDETLKTAKESGLQNILALRGDPPRGEEEWKAIDSQFSLGIDLVRYIRQSPEFSSHFCIGVAAYPDGHTGQLYDEETELKHLKAKVDAGADFIITQLFYDINSFIVWLKKVRAYGITIPILPGIMPIQTYASFARVTKLCGTRVPPAILTELEAVKHDDSLVKEYGIKLAVDMIKRLTSEGHVPGVHFCTLNLEKSVHKVVDLLQWHGPPHHSDHNRLIAETSGPTTHAPKSTDDSELLITAASAVNEATTSLTGIVSNDLDGRSTEPSQASTWDDFPNGRFGDFKSPAFGNLGPWGPLGIQPTDATGSEWGHPSSRDELTSLFLNHLHSKVSTTPFSPGALSAESMMILPYLEQLTQRGWWTVGSQPAIDGASSADDVVGWGPKAGYVFQKGFVEFFCDESDVNRIQKAALEKGNGMVQWFAGTAQGEVRGNVPDGGRNAVTWGIFPGQEVIQTTIIEKQSFIAWKDEAFSIWTDWSSFYPPQTPQRLLLEGVRNERWLVSVVHHNYKDSAALWTFLLQDVGQSQSS
ncbi:methylenetetrahydrofolate reductase-domain-containing protein [Flagelloscypha sp. PMI_526]|nr:methylenetetrahydrofolate reductase-domain-containing protein [Flagelloscypha sp. PMI_526]